MSSTARTIVGMSGGVDSSVAALQLQQAGEPIAGLFMRNWSEDDSGDCRAEDDRRDAVAVCGRLGIPMHFRDFSSEYWEGVFAHFLDAARELGADYIATGHYARVARSGDGWHLLKAVDRGKDQSYFLHQLGQEQLAATRFPLGEVLKSQVREIAREAGLPTHAKKDSTGICFIGERDFREFLARYLPARPGEMRTPDGRSVGQHPGVFYFTLGQREGLNIGGLRGFEAAPWYVVGKDVAQNVLYVDQGSETPWLQSQFLRTQQAHWIAGRPPQKRFACQAQTRYRQPDQACEVTVEDDGTLGVRFAQRQRAVTPGQSLVLYDGEICLGGAVIKSTDAVLEQRIREQAA